MVPGLALALVVGLGACGDPDPEQAADELASMKSAVNAEVRDIAGTLTAGGTDCGARATISWTRYGARELWLKLDQDGEVEVPTDTPPVDRDNTEDIPVG